MLEIADSHETSDIVVADLLKAIDPRVEGEVAYALIERLYPICRSITGNGVRRSLRLLRETIPLALREVVSDTPVFDWTVPDEWNIRDAYIKNEAGERVVDFQKSNLHVLNYSVPVNRKMSLAELRLHLFTIPEAPDRIPYRTSYFEKNWGFCLTQHQLDKLEEGEYHVYIDSSLHPGHLTYGEFRIQGETDDEVLISCHSCHPSLCNDNLSGMVIAARLAGLLQRTSPRFSYRFVWVPGTIGSITWLALNEAVLPRIKHGLVLSCLGDPGKFTYKRSRRGNAEIDRVVEHMLTHSGKEFNVLDFAPYGYDERQYCSPGINLPVGCFTRTPNDCYPEYHTSADDLSLVTPSALGESLVGLLRVVRILEENDRYVNLNPKCEPQLGRRGLYDQLGGMRDSAVLEKAMLWVLNLSDGQHDLLDIAVRSGFTLEQISKAAEGLREAGFLGRRANAVNKC
ncbi:MAG: peptidase M28 [Acidobacteria bacterium]|nr:MAG: peptidase M28 [Acidobacteriota bacterium]